MQKIRTGFYVCDVCDDDQGFASTLEGERLLTRCSCGALIDRPTLLPRKAAA